MYTWARQIIGLCFWRFRLAKTQDGMMRFPGPIRAFDGPLRLGSVFPGWIYGHPCAGLFLQAPSLHLYKGVTRGHPRVSPSAVCATCALIAHFRTAPGWQEVWFPSYIAVLHHFASVFSSYGFPRVLHVPIISRAHV